MVSTRLPEAFRFLFEPARYKVAHGGRGSAKSHSFAMALAIITAQRKTGVMCAREIQKSIRSSVKQLIQDKINALGLGPETEGGNGLFRFTDSGIFGSNGSFFIFPGLRTNPESIKSTEGIDIAWVEEADRVSSRSLQLLTPTVRRPGSEIWFSFNRHRVTDPVDSMFLGGEPPPRSIVRRVSWRDNPWFPDVLREEMLWDRRRDHDKYRHVWEGDPVQRSVALVFRNWTVDDLDELVVSTKAVPRLGADWGFAVDPSVLVECYVWPDKRLLYFRDEAWKVGCAIDELPALFAGDDDRDPPRWRNTFGHRGVASARRHRITADSARPDTVAYMKARGFDIRSARKGPGSVEEGVEFLKSFDVVVHPRCVHVQQELRTYSYKTDPLTDLVLPDLADWDNHTIDAARYALEGVRRPGRAAVPLSGAELVDPNN